MKQNHFIQPDKSILVRFKGAPTRLLGLLDMKHIEAKMRVNGKGGNFLTLPMSNINDGMYNCQAS